MYSQIRNSAKNLGALNCPSCGELDIAFGTFIREDEKVSRCMFCYQPVQYYEPRLTFFFSLRVIKYLNDYRGEDSLSPFPEFKKCLNYFLSNVELPPEEKIKEFQLLLEKAAFIGFGVIEIGGSVRFYEKQKVILFEDEDDEGRITALEICVHVIKYLLQFNIHLASVPMPEKHHIQPKAEKYIMIAHLSNSLEDEIEERVKYAIKNNSESDSIHRAVMIMHAINITSNSFKEVFLKNKEKLGHTEKEITETIHGITKKISNKYLKNNPLVD